MSNTTSNSKVREKAVAFVVARLTSSRLQAKQLRTVGDRTILDWIITHLKQCNELDEIVIATVAEEENKPLISFAKERGVNSFWYEGEVDHVTTRLRRAAECSNADICLLVSADCPLLYPPALDDLISEMRQSPQMDLMLIKPKEPGKPSMMQGVLVSRKTSWQKADDMSDTPELKEHQFPIIWKSKGLFSSHSIEVDHDIYSVPRRLSVDTPADLSFQNSLYKALVENGYSYCLPDAIKLLNETPELVKINEHVHQRRFGESANNILFVTDSEESTNSEIQLARQLIEVKGWPVVFCCENDKAASNIDSNNLRCVIGSLTDNSKSCSSQFNVIDLNQIRDSFDLVIIKSGQDSSEIKAKLNELKVEVPAVQLCYNNSTEGILNIFTPDDHHEQVLCSTHAFASFKEVGSTVVELLK